ncbi:MAG: 3-oxoadipate enol-lactone hydrolase [Betaproteobacteria bacterium]|nr:3-oxoadipate enol-lactone hydrolase [Betaproteobacteria bacterium]
MKRKRSALARKGEIVRRKIHGDAHVDRNYREADEFMTMFQDVTDEFCWGTIWARPGLNAKTRAALSLTATAAQSQAGAVKMHVKTCLRTGWSKREIGEILLHVYAYAGVYACLSGFNAAREAFAEFEREHPRRPRR